VSADGIIKVGENTFKVADLTQAASEVDGLRTYRQNASLLIQGFEGPPTPQQEAAVREVMRAEQYEEGIIEEYIAAMHQTEQTPQTPEQTPTTQTTEPLDPFGTRIQPLEQRLEATETELRSERAARMARSLEESVHRTVDTNEPLTLLFKRMTELQGEAGSQARLEQAREDVHREVMAALRRRHSAGQRVDDDVFDAEAQNAAKLVAERYRAVIGDPNKLGRAPETVPGEDQLRNRKPVNLGEVGWKGEDAGGSISKARQVTESVLLDLVDGIDEGGRSRA
jgi:hypothetical protein